MAKYTNVSARLIHAGAVQLVPGQPVDVPDDVSGGDVFKEYVKAGDIKQGEVEVKSTLPQDDSEEDEAPRTQARPQAQAPVRRG